VRRVRVTIAGRVQGVFFRASCAEEARRLGLAGWVRNASDGRVEAAFEGSDRAVEMMLRWCRSGPSLAIVDDVHELDEEPRGEHGFRIVG
jgi:acylphosphatase